MSDEAQPLWKNFPELLKIELSTVTFLYVVLGLFISAVAGQNTLHFNLAQGNLPKQLVPYAPIFGKIVWFTVLNMLWATVAFTGAFLNSPLPRLRKTLATINAVIFICSLGYFGMIANHLKNVFLFIR